MTEIMGKYIPQQVKVNDGVWWLQGDLYTNGVYEMHRDTMLNALRNLTEIDPINVWLKGYCQYCHDECDAECERAKCCGHCRYWGDHA